MPAHVHADLMKQYYEDALETDKPWERWERQPRGSNMWTNCTCTPDWAPTTQYRRKRSPLCQVEGRDVFPGDKLWNTKRRDWFKLVSRYGDCLYSQGDGLAHNIKSLTWTEPARTKTVYQWAFLRSTWQVSIQFYETEEQARKGCVGGTNFSRLEYTALEVPA